MSDQRLVALIEAVLSDIQGYRIATRTAERLAAEIVGDGYVPADIHAALTAERDALREALTPSGDTKASYMGELDCDCPTQSWKHHVPWTSIKIIMKMIAARAAPKGHTNG